MLLCAAVMVLFCCGNVCGEVVNNNAEKHPKYIFLFIGDGMAAPQRMTANEFSVKMGKGVLAINQMPFHATTRTSSHDSLVTDSAAAATAIACGTKTKNGMIGVDAEGRRLQSVAEAARDKGRKVGIITSVTLNHATPAGFYGHRLNRSQYYDLGLDMIASGFDFFGGGGIADFDRGKTDIFTLAGKAGYKTVAGKNGLQQLKTGEKVIALACLRDQAMPYELDRNADVPSLADITAKAIEVLQDDPDGFFIMVEGGAIDWAGHANEAAANLREVLALDAAVKEALKFYHKHPDETLIVVTGDHETGGMTMGFAGSGYAMYMERLIHQKCSVKKFDEMLKAVPQITFDEAKKMLTDNFGFKFDGDSSDPMFVKSNELKQLQNAFAKNNLANAAKLIMNRKAGIGWTSGAHTALPVLTTSIGCGAEKFTGFFENTAVSTKLKSLL